MYILVCVCVCLGILPSLKATHKIPYFESLNLHPQVLFADLEQQLLHAGGLLHQHDSGWLHHQDQKK